MQEALWAFGELPQESIPNLLLKGRRQQEGNPFTVGEAAQARGQPAHPTTTSVWQVRGIPWQGNVIYTNIAVSSVWERCSAQRFSSLNLSKPNLNINSTYPPRIFPQFSGRTCMWDRWICAEVYYVWLFSHFFGEMGKVCCNFNGSRWAVSVPVSGLRRLRWLCVLESGEVVPLGFCSSWASWKLSTFPCPRGRGVG